MNSADRRKIFERLRAANPKPTTELRYRNSYQLLVAVTLSAQATDKSVNAATLPLFARVKTPADMLRFGEEKLRESVRTIGLFRTKAKNIIAAAKILLEKHGGEIPRDRESLESLPGVGRKTANVILNTAFGEPTIAVDTHIFRLANRTGIAPGKKSARSGIAFSESRPRRICPRRPSLADSARTLYLPVAQAEVRYLPHRRPVRISAQNIGGIKQK